MRLASLQVDICTRNPLNANAPCPHAKRNQDLRTHVLTSSVRWLVTMCRFESHSQLQLRLRSFTLKKEAARATETSLSTHKTTHIQIAPLVFITLISTQITKSTPTKHLTILQALPHSASRTRRLNSSCAQVSLHTIRSHFYPPSTLTIHLSRLLHILRGFSIKIM